MGLYQHSIYWNAQLQGYSIYYVYEDKEWNNGDLFITGSIYDGGDGGINGSTVIAINAEALGPIDETKKRISNFVKFLKDVEPMDGSEGVLYPGEVEIRNRVNKRASGVEIEDATWNQVCELIDEYNVRAELEPLPN